MRLGFWGVGLAATGLLAMSAQAGKRTLLWTWDVEPVPQGVVELEQWVWARAMIPAADPEQRRHTGATTAWIWFGPVYGLTEHLEVALPWEALVTRDDDRITNVTAEVRLRLYDRLDEQAFVRPLVRLFYQQNFNHPDNGGRWLVPWAGGNVVVAIGRAKGAHAAVDAGIITDLRFQGRQLLTHTLGAGYSHPVSDFARVGVEYYHEMSLAGVNPDRRFFFAGPSLGFARHRFWATLGALAGLTRDSPGFMPRVMIGAAL